MSVAELRRLRYNYLTSLAVARAGPYRDDLVRVVREIEGKLRELSILGKWEEGN